MNKRKSSEQSKARRSTKPTHKCWYGAKARRRNQNKNKNEEEQQSFPLYTRILSISPTTHESILICFLMNQIRCDREVRKKHGLTIPIDAY